MGKTEGTPLTDVDNSTERKKSRKRRHSVIDDAETVSDHRIVKKDKKSKRRNHEPEAIAGDLKSDDVAEDESGNGKERKRKKNRKNITRNEAHDSVDMPMKKKHRNKTGFTDPNEDEVLQDKSRKCLAYAFLQFHRPSKWKFNKACQNWLIRNFWSVKEVPEAYVSLVTAYFANVQGGARENLVKICHVALAAEPRKTEVPSSELPASDTSLAVKSEPPLEADGGKRIRAQAVLDALASPSVSLE